MRVLVLVLLLSLAACGKQGPAGANGRDGESIVGPRGEQGLQGMPGQDAELEVIQLCPSLVGSDSFTEYLLRIEGELFGVYSHGNRIFMARLVPGTYKTTDGRQCNFVVTNEGEVQ